MNTILTIIALFLCSMGLYAQDANPGREAFKSNLPIVFVDTESQLTNTEKRPAHMRVLYQAGKKQYASTDTDYEYDGPIAIKLRGNSSLSFSQKKYTLVTQNVDGTDADVSLMGMPAEHDWVLLAPYADVSMLRDAFAFQLWRDMGYWAPHTVMCEVVVDGQYAGVYALTESIKRGRDRVDVAKMKPTDTDGCELTGGYLLRIDTYDEKDATFQSKVPGIGEGLFMSQVTWTCMYPKRKNLQPEQLEYIKNFIGQMEETFQSDNYADPTHGYRQYIDVQSFVDYFIHTELSLNADAYKRSAYFYKDKQNADGTGGLLHAGTVWDYNLAYGCCSFCNADDIDAWAFEGCNTNPTPMFWKRLAQDPAFFAQVKQRYAELRKTTLSTRHLFDIIDGYATQLKQAQKRHFARFPELLGTETKRNPAGSGMMAGFPAMMPDTTLFRMPEGGFPAMGMMPGFGTMMPDSTAFQMPRGGFPAFPFGGFGRFPGMMPGGGFPTMPEGGFPTMPEGGFPTMPQFGGMMGGGMPDMGAMGGMMGGGMPDMGAMGGMMDGMGGMMLSWFRSYTVKNYDDEITMLKEWLKERLEVLDDRLL